MKTNTTGLFLSICLFIFVSFQAQARVFRVNNRLTTSAAQFLYASLPEAQAVASTGDTIMVEGSPNVYSGSIDITKRLVIFGPGYFLTQNAPKQANLDAANFSGYINFTPGSQGSLISGIYIDYLYISTDNITVSRCYIRLNLYLANSRNTNNIVITQNVINDMSDNYAMSNGILANNIIYESITLNITGTYASQFNTVNNNVFNGQTLAFRTPVFQNNILIYNQANFNVENIISPNKRNNICAAGQLGTINSNQDYDPAANNLFVDPASVNNSPDRIYQLRPTSPFITAGVGGVQPGVFGGPLPYEISGIPPIPAIYEITTTGTGNSQSGLPITIKIKSY